MTLLRIFVIFDVDNSSSSHTDNCKNNFLVLGEGPTYGKKVKSLKSIKRENV